MIVQPYLNKGRSLFFRERQEYASIEHNATMPLSMVASNGDFSLSGNLITCNKAGRYELDFKAFIHLNSGYIVNSQIAIHVGSNILQYSRTKTALTANDFYFDRDIGLGADSFLPVYNSNAMANCWFKLTKQVNLTSGDILRINTLLNGSGGGTLRVSSLELGLSLLT